MGSWLLPTEYRLLCHELRKHRVSQKPDSTSISMTTIAHKVHFAKQYRIQLFDSTTLFFLLHCAVWAGVDKALLKE
jgi:hypothetical protein